MNFEILVTSPIFSITIKPFNWYLWLHISRNTTSLRKYLFINFLCFHIDITYWWYKGK